jgi:hypothetical protein
VLPIFQCVRTFDVPQSTDSSIDFTMEEHFSDLLLPLVRASESDFGSIFSRFAEDLKRKAKRASP